jgi:ubiquitin carboxyl-terminal hydrolase 8
MEDAHECLVYLIDRINDDIYFFEKKNSNSAILAPPKFAVSTRMSPSAPCTTETIRRRAQESFAATFASSHSAMVDVLYGQCMSHVTSLDTAYTSTRFEAFSTLSLPIPEPDFGARVTIYDCLDHYFRDEVLSDVLDDVADVRVRARKRHCLSRLPAVLAVTLIRFDVHGRKINRMVGVPIDVNVAKYTHSDAFGTVSSPSTKYRLFAIVNHLGSLSHGHYTATCSRGSRWYHFDDESAADTGKDGSSADIVTQHAYILFFRQFV